MYQPLRGAMAQPPEERMKEFSKWVAGYYTHGEVSVSGPAALESRIALESPPPTTANMTPNDLAESTYDPPGEPGGSEEQLAHA